MKLIERELGINIDLKENVVSVLVLENVALRAMVIDELYAQMNGKEGNWLLIDNEKTYELSKKAELILEPFSLQLNSKKIKTKLYHEIKTEADEFLYSQGLEVYSYISNYLELLLERLPYPIKYKNEWNVQELLKCYDVELMDEDDGVCERIFNYIKLMNQVCGTTVFITINLKQYLSEEQLLEVYKLVQYNKINLILIEFQTYHKRIVCEEMHILDKDNCLIIY